MSDVVNCYDCHYSYRHYSWHPRETACLNAIVAPKDLVVDEATGEPLEGYTPCLSVRGFGACGMDAGLFEPKEAQ